MEKHGFLQIEESGPDNYSNGSEWLTATAAAKIIWAELTTDLDIAGDIEVLKG